MKKTVASATIAASLLGGGAVAVVLAPQFAGAQDGEETTTTEADATPVPEGLPGWVEDAIAALVEDGTLTEPQAEAVTNALEQARPEHPRGPGHGHHGGPFGRFGGGLEALEDLGLDLDTIRQGLRDGQSLAEIAEANGVDRQAVIDALVAEATAHIEQAVADGRIDADLADERTAELAERIAAMVDGELPEGGPGFGPGGRPGPGPWGAGDDATDVPSIAPTGGDDLTAA